MERQGSPDAGQVSVGLKQRHRAALGGLPRLVQVRPETRSQPVRRWDSPTWGRTSTVRKWTHSVRKWAFPVQRRVFSTRGRSSAVRKWTLPVQK